MALVLETGECVPTANALVSRADFLAYVADYRPDVTVANSAVADAAILRASAWLSTFPIWDGRPTCGRGLQGLALPRTGMTDCNGDPIADDEIPFEAEQAAFIASLAEYVSPGILAPMIKAGEQRKRVKVDVIEVEYMTPTDQGTAGQDTVAMLRSVLTAVNDLLKCLATMPGSVKTPWPWVA